MNDYKPQTIPVTTKLSFFKKESTGTIILICLILIVVIIFFGEITQPLWIISKSIEFEPCHMKL